MDRRLIASIVALPGILILVAVLCTYQIVNKHCLLWTCAPNRSFTVWELDVPVEFFPEGSRIVPMHKLSSDDTFAIESGLMNAYWNESEVVHSFLFVINRYGTYRQAEQSFQNTVYYWNRSSYADHPEFSFKSEIADEYLVGCGISLFGGGFRCDFRGRYQEYTLSLGTTISPSMDVVRFQEITVYVDEMMKQYLDG